MSSRLLFTMILLGCASSVAGGHDEVGANAALLAPPPAPLVTAPSFVELHSARVEKDLLRFFTPVEVVDALDVRRDRDKLLLFRGPQPAQGGPVALGAAMFGAATILSAHAPRTLRILFDGPVHLGPAIFDGGGMGAGIAGHL